MQDQDTNMAEQPEFVNPKYSLFVLQLIKGNQQQHGLRHNDPKRYWKYCSNRLRRLYCITKTLHGKRQFRKVELKVEGVKTVTYLHIPLLQAERAWAVAMSRKLDLEKVAQSGEKGRHTIRSNMMSKLSKAVMHSKELFTLCKCVCDMRTQIEVSGYCSYLQGQQEMEKESFGRAFVFLSRANMMFDALSQLGEPHQPAGQQSMCRSIVTQINDQIRVCKYQLERSGEMDTDFTPLQQDLQLLIGIEGMRESTLAVENLTAENIVCLTWLGDSYPVVSSNATPAIQQLISAESSLKDSMDTEDFSESKQQIVGDYSSSLQSALKSVQDALDSADKDVDAEKSEKLEALKWAIKGKQLQHVLSAGEQKVQGLQDLFEDTLLKQLASGKKALKGKQKDGGSFGKPEDLVKLYDQMMNAANELEQLAMDNLSGMVAERLLSESAFKCALFKAFRCYYVGHAYLRKQRQAEAYALFQRVSQLIDSCKEKMEDMMQPVPDSVSQAILNLKSKAFAFQVVAKAEFDASKDRKTKAVQQGIENINLSGAAKQIKKQPKTVKYLLDNLDAWDNFAGEHGKNVRLFKIPPDPEMIPMRPILLNTAEQYLEMPSLKHRYPQKQESMLSGVSRFFSFGMGSKK
eukprot:TRINITY_DN4360_c0_g3_i2.p1 TRINITY_DN4360_c0_g3~~TRINITY_DN4360_c0_g3_i2.p1  ORF type:complete len:639 (+),score=116.95 TRINITY_DN4360_c0_g3_i2:24-1919(+)